MSFEVEKGKNPDQVMAGHRVWEKRKPILRRGLKRPPKHWRELLKRCGEIDRSIKGLSSEDSWLQLESLAMAMSGIALPDSRRQAR
jgi:DNA polymerase-3 subunit delta